MFYEEVFRAFNESEIEYLVSGGLAVNLHGVPRMTQDLDLLLAMTEHNIKRAVTSLEELGYRSRLPVDPMDFADQNKRDEWSKTKNMKAFTFINPDKHLQQVDFLFDLPQSFEQCRENSIVMQASDMPIRSCQ